MMRIWMVCLTAVSVLMGDVAVEEFAGKLSRDIYQSPKQFESLYGKRYTITTRADRGMVAAVLRGKKEQWVVFRGTDELSDWLVNLDTQEVSFEDVQEGLVHAGFFRMAQQEMAAIALKQDMPVYVCGHSLGGALALLYGVMLYEKGYDVSVVTFGAPPVGNSAFVDAFDALSHIRYEHLLDPVPKATRESMEVLQKLLAFVDENSMEEGSIKRTIAFLKTTSYQFVHHGEERMLTHIIEVDNPFSSEILLLPIRYHSMESYTRAFDPGPLF